MAVKRIPTRVSNAILKSLGSGVVPRIGLEHIAVGRKAEITSILEDLDSIADGGASFRFFIGRYGSGKSFMIQLIRNYAMDRNYVVADVDLSPERRLYGADKGIGTYRELIKNFSTRTKPSGGAITAVLERWISKVQSEVITNLEQGVKDPAFIVHVEKEIMRKVDSIKDLVHGFDFAKIIVTYWQGYKLGDDTLKENALKWLRGEYPNKTLAKKELGVSVIIDDATWYDYIKLLAKFCVEIGYKGLLIFFDEAVNLYKITHSQARQNNYEKILTMFNDAMQGKAEYIGIFFGGTPQFLDDRRRGLYSYEALRSRLTQSRFLKEGQRDVSGPIIFLDPLTLEEIYVLLTRIRDIHALHYKYPAHLTELELNEFIKKIMGRIGASKLVTPREFVRNLIVLLNYIRNNPGNNFLELIQSDLLKSVSENEQKPKVKNSKFAEFSL